MTTRKIASETLWKLSAIHNFLWINWKMPNIRGPIVINESVLISSFSRNCNPNKILLTCELLWGKNVNDSVICVMRWNWVWFNVIFVVVVVVGSHNSHGFRCDVLHFLQMALMEIKSIWLTSCVIRYKCKTNIRCIASFHAANSILSLSLSLSMAIKWFTIHTHSLG